MTVAEELRESSDEVERACALLLTPAPGALDGCSVILEAAVARLQTLRPSLQASRGDADALAEAWRLQRNVRRAGLLLGTASEYHAQWNELLGVRTAGYGPGGHAPDPPRAGRFSLRG